MRKSFITILFGLASAVAIAQNPSFKVDFCLLNRPDAEVLEPGYTKWTLNKDVVSDSIMIENVKCKIYVSKDDSYKLRLGWNKAWIQNETNKAKNGRLTGDFINLDPDGCGKFTLRIEGLPKGSHKIQTYHNSTSDPATCYGYPITIKCNGTTINENVMRTFQVNVAADACIVTTSFTIADDGDAVELEFSTSEDNPGTGDATHTKANKSPLLNGFELNTVSVMAQAKNPIPASGDIHIDADSGSYTLSWSPANATIKKHLLYIGKDSSEVSKMTVPTAQKEYADTTYQMNDLYSLDTYYWRVDEMDADGNVTKGPMWYFRPRHLAFPGAEGYGRYATGGRGGIVYHVTNLKNDHNPGSLLYGLVDLKGPRTIVFDVSGLIEMDLNSYFAGEFVTIAAQTAPGKGICLKGSNIGFTNETICRFLRAKRGYGVTGNAMGCGGNHSIIDHSTAAWGTDETFSSRGAKNISFQYSMIAEALGIADHKNYDAGTNHGFAASIGGDIATFSHDLLVNCNGRNWSLAGGLDGAGYAAGRIDIFNNVVYNWWGRTTDGGAHEVNFVNNYYKMGPDTRKTMLFTQQYEGTFPGSQQNYISGNIRENKDHTLSKDQLNDTYCYTCTNGATDPNTRAENRYSTFVSQPFFPSYATIHSAKHAFKIVTSDAGATMPCRDNQHVRVVNETVNGTYTYTGSRSGIKGEIDHEKDITGEANNGWEEWPEETRAADFDTDQDGMPNWYEKIIGSDENLANNNDDPDHDGYTLLEDYLDFMAHPYLVLSPNEEATYDVSQCFRGFTKSPSYTISHDGNSIISPAIEGSVITVNAHNKKGISVITMKVKDTDGDTFTQRLSVAVTDNTTAIQTVTDEGLGDVARMEFFTIDGMQIKSHQMKSHEAYILKTTYNDGKIRTVKIIKD